MELWRGYVLLGLPWKCKVSHYLFSFFQCLFVWASQHPLGIGGGCASSFSPVCTQGERVLPEGLTFFLLVGQILLFTFTRDVSIDTAA